MMTTLHRDVKTFILKALLAADGEPMTDDTLKGAVVNAFRHVAFTGADITRHVSDCEREGWIAGTNDELFGIVWTLTPKGTIRAQSLR